MILSALPVFTVSGAGQNVFAEQVIPASNLSAFENGYAGYSKSMDVFEGKSVHVLKRTGADETENNFCYYRWGVMYDENNELIPLSTANYLVVDYYYFSPDESPALLNNHMRWTQVKVSPDSNISGGASFSVTTRSREPLVANKWAQAVLPLGEAAAEIKKKFSDETYYLHQVKLYPLDKMDMGKNDILYISNIKVQSWDPALENSVSERTINFYDSEESQTPVTTLKANDLEYFTVPEFSGKLPENTEFVRWINKFDKTSAKPGEKIQMLAGQDIGFVPEFNYVFNFSGFDAAYINGYNDGSFKPQGNVTRAEACKIIATVTGSGKSADLAGVYSDIKPQDWFYPYVSTLYALGALDIFEGTFDQSKQITRSELVEIIYAIADTNFESMKLTYVSDVDSKDRCFDAVMYAISAGIITGYEDGSFRPDNNITRAETVTIINRLLGRSAKSGGISKFSDIDGHWAKDQIIASSSERSEGCWETVSTAGEYVLEGTNTEGYIKALHSQAKNLSGDAIRRGIDTVAEQMKKDILSAPNTQVIYADKLSGNTYYVSEKNGNDENDGKSPETALKTLEGLKNKFRLPKLGTAVLFERGGVYRGQITTSPGCIYGAYGEGDKPIITGSAKNYADASLWVETEYENVYRLTDAVTNAGIITFDHKPTDHGNYDALYGKNRIYGKNIQDCSGLASDLEFLSTPGVLYLYSEGGNPGTRFSSIEIGTGNHLTKGSGANVVFDNLHFKNTGAHAINFTSANNLTVTNCEFSWLGGSLMGTYGSSTSQYGNAVQIYGSCDGYYVKDNWMYQIYDTAITHQGPDYNMKNIEYSGNLMEYVHWGIECWMSKTNKDPELSGYLAKYNVMRNGGYGWGTIVSNRPGAARLYSFTSIVEKNSDLHSEYNIIDRCTGYLIDLDSDSTETVDSNIYVQDENNLIGRLKGTNSTARKDAILNVRNKLGDNNAVFVLIPR